MPHHFTRFISIILLVAFVGLLGFGLVMDNVAGQHSDHTDCFGVGCGPVQHTVFHVFVLPSSLESAASEFYTAKYNLLATKPAFFVKAPDTPPPQFSLV